MNRLLLHFASVCLLWLGCAGVAHAQLFKWIGPDGKTNYSDTPPPPTAVRTEKKSFAGNVVDSEELPFALAGVVKSQPVTLYTGAKCPPCDDARALLKTRGIPFSEKTISSNADVALMGGGSVDLPQMTVGTNKQRGFEASAWNASLTAAGYPETNTLPKSYRGRAAEPAAPVVAINPATRPVTGTAEVATAPKKSRPSPAPEAAVPGLRF